MFDRFLATSQWEDLFPHAKVTHGVAVYSNHLPICLDTKIRVVGRRKERLFRFETMWMGEKGCEDIIEDTWRRGNVHHGVQNVMSLISECSERLTA